MDDGSGRALARGGYLRPLDGLRTVAVLLVFGAHAVGDVLPGGFVGVDIFFVLSGFLITTLLAAEWRNTDDIQVRHFYARRFLRLYPAMLLALALCAAVTPRIGRGWSAYFADAAGAVTYTLNIIFTLPEGWTVPADSPIGHFWSLCVEEQYYLVWPLALVWMLRRGGAELAIRCTLAATVGAAVLKAVLVPILDPSRLYFLPFGHADELLVGSSLGLVLLFRDAPTLRRALASPVTPWLCALPIAAVALTLDGIQTTWLYLGGLLALATASAGILGHVSERPDALAARLLSLPPMVWIGRRSYAFYLYHQPVIFTLRDLGWEYRVIIPVGLAVTLLLVAVSWPVERRFLRLKERFASRPAPAVEPAR